jgi:glycosyltransferase involved in cell wall biosynthesis
MKIGISHYRIGKTDGVSLEIMKRKELLQQMGHEVRLISGPKQIGADYVIPELEFDIPEIIKIKENAFFDLKDYPSDNELLEDIYRVSDILLNEFLKIHEKEKFDALFLHNIFSHGRHIAAAKACYDFAVKTGIRVVGVNHDFYSVGSYTKIYKPQTQAIRDYLQKYVPPTLPNIKHVTINSVNQQALMDMKGIPSTVFPDTFNFDEPEWKKDEYNSTFLHDIGIKENDFIVLQATRITDRKGIEMAIDLVKELTDRKQELLGKTLYNGKKISEDSDIVFLLAGYTELASMDYRKKLDNLIANTGIKAVFASDLIDATRRTENGKKIYALWDAYVFADLVTYPSTWEGWGNQFIEAVFAKKPVALFEYPVFKSDIRKEGYTVITFGDTISGYTEDGLVKLDHSIIQRVANEVIAMITDPKTVEVMNENFKLGDKYHGNEFLKKLLMDLVKGE